MLADKIKLSELFFQSKLVGFDSELSVHFENLVVVYLVPFAAPFMVLPFFFSAGFLSFIILA